MVDIVGEGVASGKVLVESMKFKGLWDGGVNHFSGTGECVLNKIKFAALE